MTLAQRIFLILAAIGGYALGVGSYSDMYRGWAYANWFAAIGLIGGTLAAYKALGR